MNVVRCRARDPPRLARAELALLVPDAKAHRTAEDKAELLVLVAVLGHHALRVELDDRERHPLTVDGAREDPVPDADRREGGEFVEGAHLRQRNRRECSDMSALACEERPAEGATKGLLILHHGRGANEHDLLPLGEVLDPAHELHVIAPRAPLSLPGMPGFHWYEVPRVGYPDPATFFSSVGVLARFHDEVWARTGLAPERTVLGGFSMGSAMSFALGLHPERPRPAGILAFSGFVPTVEGWTPDLEGRRGLPAFIAHGREDPVIGIGFGRKARGVLESAGLAVEYHESDVGHQIDRTHLPAAIAWLGACLSLDD